MKAKKLLLEMLIIVSFVSGVGFWMLGEWRKWRVEPIKVEMKGYLDETRLPNTARHTNNFTVGKSVKIYQGIWHKTYLEVIK